MNVSKPSQCVFCSFSRYVTRASPARRKFHASTAQLQRQPSRQHAKAKLGSRYKPAELEKLREVYSPEQMAAIEAGEKAVSGVELSQTSERVDPWSPNYFDDLSKVDPFLDKPVRAPWSTADETPRMKTEDELDEELAQLLRDMPAEEHSEDQVWENYLKNMRVTVGGDSEGFGRSAAAPEAPNKIKQKNPKQKEVQGEASPALVRLMQMTGYSFREISALRVKSIISHAVVNQTRLGKIRKSYFLSVAGNGNGRIGIGEGKSEEGSEAMLQSQYRAIRNMQPILRYEKRTIFGEVHGKVSATELELYARPPGMLRLLQLPKKNRFRDPTLTYNTGFGLRCQQYIWEVCKCAGISDLAAKVTRARNPMNIVKATVEALLKQKDPEEIARARGKKLVDVRKVYYAGNV